MPTILLLILAWTAITAADGGADILLQYGPLGVFALLLTWFAKSAIQRERDTTQRERDRGDRLEAELNRVNMMVLDKAIPALMSASRATEEHSELSSQILAVLQREQGIPPNRRTRLKGSDA